MNTTNGLPMGKVKKGECTLCNSRVAEVTWLCDNCVNKIGQDNISDMIHNIPEYLGDYQYNNWLRLTLLKYVNGNNF